MAKRVLSLFLCVVLMLGCINIGCFEAGAVSTESALISLAKKFPNGKYWNHIGSKTNSPDSSTNTACDHHFTSGCSIEPGGCECNSFLNAIQCKGFAYKSAYDIVGSDPREWDKSTNLNLSELCVGDIIRYLNDGHSVTVVGVNGDTIAYVGANWGGNCLIKWGQMTKDNVRGFSYVLHDPNNKRKNTNINIYEKVVDMQAESLGKCEKWRVSAYSYYPLNIRVSASTSSASVGQILVGQSFFVTKKVVSDDYLWGYVYINGLRGWAALDYAEYVSGSYDELTVKSVPSDITAGNSFQISFSAVDGAEYYDVSFYDAKSRLYSSEMVTGTSGRFYLFDGGKYTVKVTALNSRAPSWGVAAKPVTIKVADKITVNSDNSKSTEVWRVNGEKALEIRKTTDSGSKVLGSIPAGKSFKVTAKADSGKLLWGQVKYGGVSGWVVLNDVQYVSGTYEKPNIKTISSYINTGVKFSLEFAPVSGASGYKVEFYDSGKNLYRSKTVKSCSARFVFYDTGNYKVKVTAINSKAPSWTAVGSTYAFYVGDGSMRIEKITVPANVTMAKGSAYRIRPQFTPSEAGGGVIWKSSNPDVATVSTNGKVIGVGYGKARIYCISEANSLIKAYTDVIVSTQPVKKIWQIDTKTDSDSAVIKWDKVPEANGYVVYYDGKKLKRIGKTEKNYLEIKGLKSDTSSNIVVCAYVTANGKNYVSKKSSTLTVLTSPTRVTSVKVTDIKSDSAVLRWNKSAGADVYRVYKYVKGKGYVPIGVTKKNYYKIKGNAETVYKLKVRAVKKVGDRRLYSDFSDYAFLVFQPGRAKLSAASGKDTVTLKWNKVKGASGYEVYIKTAKGFEKIKTLSASSTEFKKTGLKRNTTYTFRVRSYTKAGSTKAYAPYSSVDIKTK